MNEPLRDVVVLLPGIMGSVLQRDGKDVWAFSKGAAVSGLFSLGGTIKQLELGEDPHHVDDLGDGITAPRLMPDLHLIPGLWKIDGYEKIGRRIRESPGVTPGQNYFEFPYDWRRDNRVAARQLASKSREWLRAWRTASGNDGAKLVLVGHSMGGIVARIFVELLEGWRDTRVLVTFGTPFGGSVNALEFLANGFRKGIGPFSVDLTDTIRSFTSVYQLLPVFKCLETPSGLARVADAPSLGKIDVSKVRAAASMHGEIRATVDANRANDYGGTGGYGLRPLVGDFQPTRQSARFDGDEITSLRSRNGKDEGGDGTVPKLSAVPHELLDGWTNVTFYAEAHASLQNFDPVLTQLASLLRNLDIDTRGYYAVNTKLSVEIDDLFWVDEPIPVRARPEYPVDGLEAVVTSVATGGEVARVALTGELDGWLTADLAPLLAGDYRVTVRAATGVDPVTEVFAVFDPNAPDEGLGSAVVMDSATPA
jgi:pimeloyl-ACP methyl ester carboxylesterase